MLLLEIALDHFRHLQSIFQRHDAAESARTSRATFDTAHYAVGGGRLRPRPGALGASAAVDVGETLSEEHMHLSPRDAAALQELMTTDVVAEAERLCAEVPAALVAPGYRIQRTALLIGCYALHGRALMTLGSSASAWRAGVISGSGTAVSNARDDAAAMKSFERVLELSGSDASAAAAVAGVTGLQSAGGTAAPTAARDAVLVQMAALAMRSDGGGRGHWNMCPNGHYYVIADCGGAMLRGRCPECSAEIGGESHRLAAGNRHTGAFDGSEQSSWPT
jgi:hypothetical protein